MKKTLLFAAACSLMTPSPSLKATTVYALTNGGNILTFDSESPGTLTSNVATNPGDFTLLAIDVRPTVQPSSANPGVGSLWAIGQSNTTSSTYQLFVIDPATGTTTAVGSPYAAGLNPAAGISTWGFDFNPSTDRIRLVDSSANNYRLNPNNLNGVVTNTDPDLSYVTGDTNFGTSPHVDGGAYTSAAFGGSTSLYYLDTSLGILAKAVDPDLGTLQTVGSLDVAIGQPNGFDIFQTLALFSVQTGGGSALYAVNLATGAATLKGNLPSGVNVRGLAISTAVPVPPQAGPPNLLVFGKTKRTVVGTPALVRGNATDDSGTVALSYRVANRSASFTGAPYSTPFAMKVRRLAIGNNRVIIRATDPEGQKTDVKITIVRRHSTTN